MYKEKYRKDKILQNACGFYAWHFLFSFNFFSWDLLTSASPMSVSKHQENFQGSHFWFRTNGLRHRQSHFWIGQVNDAGSFANSGLESGKKVVGVALFPRTVEIPWGISIRSFWMTQISGNKVTGAHEAHDLCLLFWCYIPLPLSRSSHLLWLSFSFYYILWVRHNDIHGRVIIHFIDVKCKACRYYTSVQGDWSGPP